MEYKTYDGKVALVEAAIISELAPLLRHPDPEIYQNTTTVVMLTAVNTQAKVSTTFTHFLTFRRNNVNLPQI